MNEDIPRQCLECNRRLSMSFFTSGKKYCKMCMSERNKAHYQANKDKMRQRAYERRQVFRPPKEPTKKDLARKETKAAIKRGDLVKPKGCEICARHRKLDIHHPNYDYPLMIFWLCEECHTAVSHNVAEPFNNNWQVRYYNAPIQMWVEVSGRLSEEQADQVWDDFTDCGRKHTQDDGESYFEVQCIDPLM
jgi:hypothetical protein